MAAATAALTDAEAKKAAADDAAKQADKDGNGLITQEEAQAVADANAELAAAKQAAQNAVDQVPAGDRGDLQARVDALTPANVPAVTDTDGNGVADTTDLRLLTRKVSLLEASQARIEGDYKLYQRNGLSSSEADEIVNLTNRLFSLKNEVLRELAVFPDASDLHARANAVQGVSLSEIDRNQVILHEKLLRFENQSLLAREYKDQILNDGVISKNEVDNLESKNIEIQNIKNELIRDIETLQVSKFVKSGFEERLSNVKPIILPHITDMNNDGVNDVDYDVINNSLDSLKVGAQNLDTVFNHILTDGRVEPDEFNRLQNATDFFMESRKDFVSHLKDIPEGDVKNSFLEELSRADSRTINIGQITNELNLSLSEGNDHVSLAGIVTGDGLIHLGKGNDSIDIETITSSFIVNGGEGNDSVFIGFTLSSANLSNFEEVEVSSNGLFKIDISSLEALNNEGSVIKIKGQPGSVVDLGGQGGSLNLSDNGGTWYQAFGDSESYVVYKHSGGSSIELWFDQQHAVTTII
ncbi:Uncharacterised protein [Escherichia coli]|nr:Uncharacterised protein [Escherichia coli]